MFSSFLSHHPDVTSDRATGADQVRRDVRLIGAGHFAGQEVGILYPCLHGRASFVGTIAVHTCMAGHPLQGNRSSVVAEFLQALPDVTAAMAEA